MNVLLNLEDELERVFQELVWSNRFVDLLVGCREEDFRASEGLLGIGKTPFFEENDVFSETAPFVSTFGIFPCLLFSSVPLVTSTLTVLLALPIALLAVHS